MGRASFKDGAIFAQNLQAGSVTLTLGGTGSDTTSVVFAHKMKNVPVVIPSIQSDVVITDVRAHTRTASGFTLEATSGNLTSSCTFGYIAFDDSFR